MFICKSCFILNQITSNAEVLQEPAIKPTTWNVKNFVLALKKKVFYKEDIFGPYVIACVYCKQVDVSPSKNQALDI